jgi:ABC-type lipoprotein export system ATPase subunit
MDSIVTATDVRRRYGEGDAAVDALAGVSVSFERGRFSAIMGPSGSGKSTLMHILAGLDRPTSGSVVLDDVDITDLDDGDLTKLRRDKLGFIFQFFNLIPVLTAEENIVLPLSIAGKSVDEEWLHRLVETVGLTDRLTHRPAELSGGQQQRVAVARALVSRPARMCISVDLPEPEGPMIAVKRSRSKPVLTPSRASTAVSPCPKRRWRSVATTTDPLTLTARHAIGMANRVRPCPSPTASTDS